MGAHKEINGIMDKLHDATEALKRCQVQLRKALPGTILPRPDLNLRRGCAAAAARQRATTRMRKLIAFDDDTFDKLTQLGRDRMGTLQELADEAFADLLRKHGIPIDLKDALRKSATVASAPAARKTARPRHSRKPS
jgi:hypothetical protein